MSQQSNIIDDMRKLYEKYGFFEEPFTVDRFNFRNQLLTEEFNEIQKSIGDGDPEEFVDGMIDIVVIAIGTLHMAGVDVHKAWDEVMKANMAKERGVKDTRPESGGFDLKKPDGWKAPSHINNHGVLDEFKKSADS